jgi:hypothetical protein
MARVQIPITQLGIVAATLTTALTGTNNDLLFAALAAGPEGNSIRIKYVVSGASTPLTVIVDGLDITVNVATDGGSAAISTAAQIAAAIAAHPVASQLVSAANAPSNDGSGVVTSLSFTNLAGGALGVAIPAQTNADATNKHYLGPNTGDVILEVVSSDASAQTVTIKAASADAAAGTGGDRVEPIAAGATRILGPFEQTRHNQDHVNKQLYIDPSVSTNLKFRAYKSVRAA